MEASTSARPTRLMITQMVLENFKSYAGVQEIGPFHKRFSSIVGPNGSGKSNVIDALLFVFGKRAKQLRLNKVSELIHKSAGFPNLDYARVSVHFQLIYDNEESADDFEVVPGSEFIVSRTALQNNQSKYTVDGKNSNYTDVGLLLRSHGIDLDNNRFLILQGEVEQIAMMKPKGQTPHEEGLLEYLEDIIGSNQFVPKIDEIGKTLETLNEQRVEKVNRLKVSEKERDNLSGAKADVEALMENEKETRRRKNILYQAFEADALQNVAKYTERRDQAKEKLAYEKSKLGENEIKLKAIEADYKEKQSQHEKVSKHLESTQADFSAFERRDVKIQEDMKHAKEQSKKHKANVQKEQKKEEECTKSADEALNTLNNAREKTAELQTKRDEEERRLEEITEGLKGETQGIRDSLELKQAELADAERSIGTLQTDKEALQTAIQLQKARVDDATRAVAATEQKLEQFSSEVQTNAGRMQQLENEKAQVETQVTAMEQRVQDCGVEEGRIQTSIREAVALLAESRDIMAAQQSSGKKNAEVETILNAAKKGGPLALAGVRGRLGDLATIAPEYDVAISTCCSFLDYIVVDTMEGGQACVNFLREKNIGRASFIILDQMKQWQGHVDRVVTTPNGTPRLFDLINVSDPSLLTAFYFALRDALVAPDLDVAVRIAYVGDKPMWRVVTSDGDLIDVSGCMSGGGKVTKSGLMKLASGAQKKKAATSAEDEEEQITPAKIQAMEARLAECEAALAKCRSDKTNAERTIKEGRARVKAIGVELEKLRMAAGRFQEQEQGLRARLDELRSQTSMSDEEVAEVQNLENQLEDLDRQIIRRSPNIAHLRHAVVDLQQQILAVGGPKLKRAQANVDQLNAQLSNLTTQAAKKEVEEQENRKQANKAAAARVKAEKDLTAAEEKLAGLIAERAKMEEDALQLLQAVEEADKEVAIKEEELKAITAEYQELSKIVGAVRDVESKLLEAISEAEVGIKTNNATAKDNRKQLEAVRKEHLSEQQEFLSSKREVLRSVRRAEKQAKAKEAAEAAAKAASAASGEAPDASKVATAAAAAIDIPDADGAGEDDEDVPMEEEEDGLENLADVPEDRALLSEKEIGEIKREIGLLEAERNKMCSKDMNMSALIEYIKKDAQYRSRLADLEAITAVRNAARREFEDLRRLRLEMFMSGFGCITLKLKEMYQMITLGGDAELELVDSLDPFSEGIVFSVRPPKKSWKNISNLSGGEKTLSSLALVFALHHYKPTPLYVMDEIDAALDFKNVSIVANYIKDRTKNAQFVIISLRNNMFELADRLVGIYKTHDATKSVTINPRMFAAATEGKRLAATAAAAAANKESSADSGARPRAILGDATNVK